MQQLSAILAKRLPSNSTKSIESIVVPAKSSESSKGRRVDEVDRVDRRSSQVDRIHSTRSTAGYSHNKTNSYTLHIAQPHHTTLVHTSSLNTIPQHITTH